MEERKAKQARTMTKPEIKALRKPNQKGQKERAST
jgi:hypothetical protein